MWRSFLAEWRKIRRPSVLSSFAIMVVLTVLIIWIGLTRAVRRPEGGISLAVLGQSPGGLVYVLQRGANLIALIALVTVCVVVAAEWSQGTLRTVLVREPRRIHFLAGKYLALLLFTEVSAVVAAAAGIAAAFIAASQQGVDTSAWTSTDGMTALRDFVLDMLFMILTWTLFGTLIAVLVRNAAVAVGATIGWLLIVEGLVGAVWPELEHWLPGNVLHTVLDGPARGIFPLSTPNPTSVTYLTYIDAILIGVAYCAGFALVAAALFRQRDVTV